MAAGGRSLVGNDACLSPEKGDVSFVDSRKRHQMAIICFIATTANSKGYIANPVLGVLPTVDAVLDV